MLRGGGCSSPLSPLLHTPLEGCAEQDTVINMYTVGLCLTKVSTLLFSVISNLLLCWLCLIIIGDSLFACGPIQSGIGGNIEQKQISMEQFVKIRTQCLFERGPLFQLKSVHLSHCCNTSAWGRCYRAG